jgi:hypothetical protein
LTCAWANPATSPPKIDIRVDATTLMGHDNNPATTTSHTNGAPACKYHNLLKEHGWTVNQHKPGHFHWTSPTGRTYDITPNDHNSPPPF